MADKVVVDSAQDFYHVAQSCPNISLLWVWTSEVDVNREFLSARWATNWWYAENSSHKSPHKG